jgi:dihydropteroate synthase
MLANLPAPCIQGILNVTPDSFSEGKYSASITDTINRGLGLVAQGAHILDVGGESTRPGYTPVSAENELQRILPVINSLITHSIYISVDTYKPSVMKAVLAAGVNMINDVNALQGEDESGSAIDIVRNSDCRLVIMDGFSLESQAQKRAGIGLVTRLSMRYEALLQAGIDASRIIIDPGIGFDKNLEDNLNCIRYLPQLKQIAPVLIGGSRKSMLGTITNKSVDMRMPASIALALLAVQRGASIVRVHDVCATLDAIKVWQAVC